VEDDGKGFDPHGGEGVWHDERGGWRTCSGGGPQVYEGADGCAGRAIGRLLGTRTGQRVGSMHPIGR
jgi:hypothetical protein